jgi:hypothetical protein
MPCGLSVDMERARFLRRGAVEMLNSRDEWQVQPGEATLVPLGEALLRHKDRWRPALSLASTLHGRGLGQLHKSGTCRDVRYHRELIIGTRRGGSLALAPSLGARFARHRVSFEELERDIIPQLATSGGGKLSAVDVREEQLVAVFRFEGELVPAWIDDAGRALLQPPERRDLPPPCRGCPEQAWCASVEIRNTPADTWRRLGLIEPDGKPTRRGIIFSFFHHGEGLASPRRWKTQPT